MEMRAGFTPPLGELESGYLPAVSGARTTLAGRSSRLALELDTPARTLGFMLSFLALRIGALREIPTWLGTSAGLCQATDPMIAQDLRAAAALEREHRLLLMEDLVELRAELPGVELGSVMAVTLDPRVARQARVRALVPAREEPLLVLAVDLELAELGRVLGPALLRACARQLGPDIDARRFIRARSSDAQRRIWARLDRLGPVLEQERGRAGSWARVGSQVCASYFECIEACVEHGRALAEGDTGFAPRSLVTWH